MENKFDEHDIFLMDCAALPAREPTAADVLKSYPRVPTAAERLAAMRKDIDNAAPADPLDVEQVIMQQRIRSAINEVPRPGQVFNASFGEPLTKAAEPSGDLLMHLLGVEVEPEPDLLSKLESVPADRVRITPRPLAKRASGEAPSFLDEPLPVILYKIAALSTTEGSRTLARTLAGTARRIGGVA